MIVKQSASRIFHLLHVYDTFTSIRSVGGHFIPVPPECFPECVLCRLELQVNVGSEIIIA